MAPKDYVSRGKTKKAAPPAPKPNLPWVRIVVTFALLAGFAAFLWNIKDSAKTTDTHPSSTVNKPSEADTLPVLEADEYGYSVDLEKEYRVDRLPSGEKLTVRQHDKSIKLIMQCGSFKSLKQAQQMEARIAFQGLDAQVRATTSKNGTKWYRVYLGPYEQKRKADVHKAKIKKAGIYSCEIWNWNI